MALCTLTIIRLKRGLFIFFAVVPLFAGAASPNIHAAYYYNAPAGSVSFGGKTFVTSSYIELECDRKIEDSLYVQLLVTDHVVYWDNWVSGEAIVQNHNEAKGLYNVFIPVTEFMPFPAGVRIDDSRGGVFESEFKYYTFEYVVDTASDSDLYIGVIPNSFDDPEILYPLGQSKASGVIHLPKRNIWRMYAVSDKYAVEDLESWFTNFQPVDSLSAVRFRIAGIEIYDLDCRVNDEGNLDVAFRPMRLNSLDMHPVTIDGKEYELYDFRFELASENISLFVNGSKLDSVQFYNYYNTYEKEMEATEYFRVETDKVAATKGDIVKVEVRFQGLYGEAYFML